MDPQSYKTQLNARHSGRRPSHASCSNHCSKTRTLKALLHFAAAKLAAFHAQTNTWRRQTMGEFVLAKFNLSEVFEERHSSAPPNFVMKTWRCAEDLGVRRRASPRGSGFWRGTRSIHTRSSTWGAQPRLLEVEASFNRAQPLHKVSLDTENGGTFGPQKLTMMATAHGRQSRDEPGNKIPGRRPESTCPRSGSYARPPPRALDGWQPRLPQRRPPAADLSDEDFAQSLLTCASDCVAHSPSTAARRAGLTQARPIDYDAGFPRSGRTTSMAAD